MNLNVTESEARKLLELSENAGPELSGFMKQITGIAYPPKIVNCTPHDISVLDDTGHVIETFPGVMDCARVDLRTESTETVCGVPVIKRSCVSDSVLPEPQYNTLYIVSGVFAQYAPSDRDDLLVVYRPIRDENGSVIGCRGFERI